MSAFVNDLVVLVTNYDTRMSCRELQWSSAEVSSWCRRWLIACCYREVFGYAVLDEQE